MVPSVFISYSRADITVALSMSKTLRAIGVRTWMDVEDLRPGESWKTAIESGIGNSDSFVILLSQKSAESAWASVELQLARKLGVQILPILIERIDVSKLPDGLSSINFVDLTAVPYREIPAMAAQAISDFMTTAPGDLRKGSGFPATTKYGAGRELWVELVAGDGVMSEGPHRFSESPPDGSIVYSLIFPLRRSAFDDVKSAALHAAYATIIIPQEADEIDTSFVVGTLSQILGPARISLRCEPGCFENIDRLAEMSVAELIWRTAENS